MQHLPYEPCGHLLTTLLVHVCRYKLLRVRVLLTEYLATAVPQCSNLSRGRMLWALEGLVIERLAVSRVDQL